MRRPVDPESRESVRESGESVRESGESDRESGESDREPVMLVPDRVPSRDGDNALGERLVDVGGLRNRSTVIAGPRVDGVRVERVEDERDG